MKVHNIKSWPQFFEPVLYGTKKFEIRKDDRGYQIGDILHLKEYIPDEDRYTGREIATSITYLMPAFPDLGLIDGYCILSLGEIVRVK